MNQWILKEETEITSTPWISATTRTCCTLSKLKLFCMTKGRMATMVENEGRVVDDQELVVVEEKDDESRKPNII